MTTTTLTRTLRADAAANVAAAVGLLVAAGPLAAAAGLDTAWPIRLAGLALLAYGAENALVARRPAARWLAALVVVDVAFAVGVLAVAVADPSGAATWLRWLLVVAADLSLAFAAAKLVGLRSRSAVAA